MKNYLGKMLFALIATILSLIAGCRSEPMASESVSFEDVLSMATSQKNEELCSKMADCFSKNICIAAVAGSKKDVKICSKIAPCEDAGEFDVTEFAIESCKSDVEIAKVSDVAIKGNHQSCLKLKGTFERYGSEIDRKDLCLTQIAINKSDTALCEKISDSELKETCLLYASLNLTDSD